MGNDNVMVVYADLPTTIGGYTIASWDGFFTVVLNQNLCYERNIVTYRHELAHIYEGDFDAGESADLIETCSHLKALWR